MNRTATLAPILSARTDGILTITLNRPDARNALSESLMGAVQLALDEAAKDRSVRVIILAAEGPVFSAGHDLKEMTAHRKDPDRGQAYYAATFAQCSRLMQTIVSHPKPVIAEVQGMATAAGCQLVASCDLVIASSQARFATPGVNIGLFCSTPMVALSRVIPRKAAVHMLLTGEPIGAEEALQLGLINRVVTPDALKTETLALAHAIAAKPPVTLKIGKEAFQRQLELPLAEAYDYMAQVMTENMLHAEADEGIGAFLEKRAPQWPKP